MLQIPTTWLLWLIWKLSLQVVDFLLLSCFETLQNFHQCEDSPILFPYFDVNVLEINCHLGMRSIRLNPASFPHFVNFSRITQTNALVFQFMSLTVPWSSHVGLESYLRNLPDLIYYFISLFLLRKRFPMTCLFRPLLRLTLRQFDVVDHLPKVRSIDKLTEG